MTAKLMKPKEETQETKAANEQLKVAMQKAAGEILKPNSPEALIRERKNQHGNWNQQSAVSQELKSIIDKRANYSTLKLTDSQREALEMIAVKISRIICGDPDHEDHWDDIAGYAILGKGDIKDV